MTEKDLKEVFRRRNNVRKLMQDPLFYMKEKDESMDLLDSIEGLLKAFKKKS